MKNRSKPAFNELKKKFIKKVIYRGRFRLKNNVLESQFSEVQNLKYFSNVLYDY